jgi:hypothetical protein
LFTLGVWLRLLWGHIWARLLELWLRPEELRWGSQAAWKTNLIAICLKDAQM